MERIYIFDTTLRDGEQTPGANLSTEEKLIIAKQLSRLGVDIIEAGFPISSPGDFEAVKLIAREVKGPIICGLARARAEDIDRAAEAIKIAERPRIHTFISTSDIHLKHQFRKTREEVLAIVAEMVARAKGYVEDVEYSPMDATRSDHEYLYKVLEIAIEAGATTVNIPDTVGYTTPAEFADLIRGIKKNVKNIDQAVISVHCHNDLGMATANSLSAVLAGARQIECAVNGLGERAGNTSLEEVVMSLATRPDNFKAETGIKLDEIYSISRMVSSLTGIPVQPNKAIVGANAFAHESGIHQDGVLKERSTYEIMRPETIGLSKSRLVLGKLSGRHALGQRLGELGYQLSKEELNGAFVRFKELADKKKEVFDEDLIALVEDEVFSIPETFSLEDVYTVSGSRQIIPEATVKLRRGDKVFEEKVWGNGPVDAIYLAIDKITGLPCELMDFSVRAVTEKKDALGEAMVKIKHKGEIIIGRGASTDVIEASAKAYLAAVNRLVYKMRERKGKED
ncbi:MAG: 2-isopropylmalate synthase [bacterium]|nr:2-isopropylmalate synthase [bacterium]